MGKSRLCYELTQALRPHGWLLLESSPVAYGQDTRTSPSSTCSRPTFSWTARDAPQTIRDKVLGKLRTLEAVSNRPCQRCWHF